MGFWLGQEAMCTKTWLEVCLSCTAGDEYLHSVECGAPRASQPLSHDVWAKQSQSSPLLGVSSSSLSTAVSACFSTMSVVSFSSASISPPSVRFLSPFSSTSIVSFSSASISPFSVALPSSSSAPAAVAFSAPTSAASSPSVAFCPASRPPAAASSSPLAVAFPSWPSSQTIVSRCHARLCTFQAMWFVSFGAFAPLAWAWMLNLLLTKAVPLWKDQNLVSLGHWASMAANPKA
mmetsp:Transcript_1612/g.4135  ORF Transcript_1612/g.4135 Transcript_1612/m.4135 type:complete len:234 (+) Transcript_1612:111-812(+)